MSTIKKVVPYIHFKDNCAEAMTFYKECFGGELQIMKVGETPMAEQMQGMESMVMHSQLDTGEWVIMASDWCAPTNYNPGNNWSVMVECSDETQQTALFDKLGAGGSVNMPLSDTFWGARFGMVKDRFGVDWMLSCMKA